MNYICDICSHQQVGPVWSGEVRCGKAFYTQNEGYGRSKSGAACSYDPDLKPLYALRKGNEIDVKNQATIIKNQFDEIVALKERIKYLEGKLIE